MNRIRSLSSGILCVCLLSAGILVAAPDALAEKNRPALSIAVIDYQAILRESKAIKSVREQAEVQRKKLQAEITDKEKKVRADSQALEKQRTVLSPAAFARKQSDLQAKVVEIQSEVQARRQQLRQAFAQADQKFGDTVVELVQIIAKEKGYNLVFNKNQILFAAPKFDITTLVLKQLNKRLPTLKVKVPAK